MSTVQLTSSGSPTQRYTFLYDPSSNRYALASTLSLSVPLSTTVTDIQSLLDEAQSHGDARMDRMRSQIRELESQLSERSPSPYMLQEITHLSLGEPDPETTHLMVDIHDLLPDLVSDMSPIDVEPLRCQFQGQYDKPAQTIHANCHTPTGAPSSSASSTRSTRSSDHFPRSSDSDSETDDELVNPGPTLILPVFAANAKHHAQSQPDIAWPDAWPIYWEGGDPSGLARERS
ncbi:hypothetical protein P7C73_g5906, partial [Tremellales sp. Uapishka_1]